MFVLMYSKGKMSIVPFPNSCFSSSLIRYPGKSLSSISAMLPNSSTRPSRTASSPRITSPIATSFDMSLSLSPLFSVISQLGRHYVVRHDRTTIRNNLFHILFWFSCWWFFEKRVERAWKFISGLEKSLLVCRDQMSVDSPPWKELRKPPYLDGSPNRS